MKSFFKLITISIQSQLYYKISFLLNMLTPVVLLIGQYLLWNSLYHMQSVNAIGKIEKKEMFSYLLIAFAVSNLFSWSNENKLSNEIRNGTVVSRCIRPMSFLYQNIADMIGVLLLQGIVNIIIIIIGFLFFSRYMQIPTFINLIIFIPCLLLGILLRLMLNDVFSLICFFSTGYLGIAWIRNALYNFFSGALIPVILFPKWLKTVTYITPFPYMLQIPIAILLERKLSMLFWKIICIQFFWIGIFLLLHCFIYYHVKKNITIAGG